MNDLDRRDRAPYSGGDRDRYDDGDSYSKYSRGDSYRGGGRGGISFINNQLNDFFFAKSDL